VAQHRIYRSSAPVASHFREATCAEVNCEHYLAGWQTILPENDTDNADWIRHQSRLRFTETRSDGTVTFRFEPGQPCFSRNTHRVSLDRPHIFTVGNGYSGFSRREPAQWVDEMGNDLHRIKES